MSGRTHPHRQTLARQHIFAYLCGHRSRLFRTRASTLPASQPQSEKLISFTPKTMQPLNLPPYAYRTHTQQGRTAIYDRLRRRYVALTPEEWVRQHFVHFLIDHKHFPAMLMANEVSLDLNGTTRRCDTVLCHRDGGRPRLIVEYKAPTVEITQAVFNQIVAYNSVLRADYLIVSNGLQHYCYRVDYATGTGGFLPDIPDYSELL